MKNKCSLLCFVMMLLLCVQGSAQSSISVPKNKYGLQLINNIQLFRQTIKADSNRQMVSLSSIIPGIVIDLRYAYANNFVHRKMYPLDTAITFLRLPAAKALQNIQLALNSQGYALKIFDAYRPYCTTLEFWKLIHDKRYVASPATGSAHNRGTAVDVTLIEAASGKELYMGTGFDNFTDSAHHSFTQLPANAVANRKLLKAVMHQFGFRSLDTEWWHYSWPGNFEVLDISFPQLLQMDAKK